MLESIIRTEEESALEPTTDNRIRSIPFKGLVDVARRLIGQTSETQKLFQRILQIHGKKMRESHTEEEIVVNVHSNDREFRKVTMPINSTIQDVHDKLKYDNDDVTFHMGLYPGKETMLTDLGLLRDLTTQNLMIDLFVSRYNFIIQNKWELGEKGLYDKELEAIENTFVTPNYIRRIVTIAYLNADFGNVYVNLLSMKELVRELRGIFSYAQPQLTRACFHLASILHKLENISENQISKTMSELLPIEEELTKRIPRTREIAMVGEDY